LCCLFFFDLRILITPLVSSNFSYKIELTENNSVMCSNQFIFVARLVPSLILLINNLATQMVIIAETSFTMVNSYIFYDILFFMHILIKKKLKSSAQKL